MGVSKKFLIFTGLAVLILAVVVTAMDEQILKVPLVEAGTLWYRDIGSRILNFSMRILSLPNFTSPWTYIFGALALYVGYQLHKLLFVPMNRVRMLGDVGYIPEGNLSMRDVANVVRKRRLAGDVPPVYPNGWFAVLESHDLKPRQSKSVSVLGLHLAVFRAEDGQAHILDAYCPHMGANLAVGGVVKGSCLECPFHGWQFRGDDGKCTHIPYIDKEDKIPDKASVKSHLTLEVNGFIHIWYHAEGAEPTWTPPDIEQISKGQWTYRGRTEHIVNAHIEEVPENGADVAHLAQVHGPIMTAGTDLRYTYDRIWSFAKHIWDGGWTSEPAPDTHIGVLRLKHSINIFGLPMPLLDMYVEAKQIGPGIVYLMFNSYLTGNGAFLHTLTPLKPLEQRMIHQVYCPRFCPGFLAKFLLLSEALMIGPGIVYLTFESNLGNGAYIQCLTPLGPIEQRMLHHVHFHWAVPNIIGKFFLLAEALMVERDIMIWNNKRYEKQPVFVKSKEDALVAKHRRWYNQFYSEHSPRLSFQKDTMDW